LINSVGFGWALRVLAFIDLASLLIAIAVLRQRPSPTKPRRLIDLSAFGTAAFNTLALGFFLMFCGAYSPFFFVAVYGVEALRLSQSTSYNMLAILGIGSALGRVFPSFAAQRYGSFAAIALSMLMCGMLQFVWGAVHNLGGLVSFSLFYGFFGGSVAGLSPVVCLEVVPSLQLAGTWIGMLLFLGSIGVLVGNPIVGAILATKSGFGGVQAFSGATLLAGSVLMIVSWECLQRQKKRAASPSNST
jgi:predicted MFS family arabinose efflux permease